LIFHPHGALEIGEQDRHLLAFAFEGRARGEDFLGEVGRGIAPRFLGSQEDRGSRGCLGLAGQWRATDIDVWDEVSVLQASPGVKRKARDGCRGGSGGGGLTDEA
jgi:hypothetical protein